MILQLDTNAKTVSLTEPDDCDEIHVEVSGSTNPADVDETIASVGAGRLVGNDAWIAVASLRAWAEGKVGDGWDKRFQAMLDQAGRAGRMNDDRSYVMAPIASG